MKAAGIRRAGNTLALLLPKRGRDIVRGLTDVCVGIAEGLHDRRWDPDDNEDLRAAVHDLVLAMPGTTDADAGMIADGVTAIVSVIAMHTRRREGAEFVGLPDETRKRIASIRGRRSMRAAMREGAA